jgi:hypothetical protein
VQEESKILGGDTMHTFSGGLLLFLALLAPMVFSCGIQTFEDLAELNPPLALKGSVNGSDIVLTFLTYNYEKNFSGFNVFVGIDGQDVTYQRKVISNIRTESVPTFITNKTFTEPTEVTLTITIAYQNHEPLKTMGTKFWMGVSAYDAVYRVDSKTSNPVYIDTAPAGP